MTAKSWTEGVSGTWGNSQNWSPTGAPGSLDDALIDGPSGPYQTINGIGSSASLTFIGDTMLSGVFATGALAVGTSTSAGGLTLYDGDLVAHSAALEDAAVVVGGADTTLSVAGQLTLGGGQGSASLVLASAGAVQAGSVVLAPAQGGDAIIVQDSLSSVEIGTGTGQAGAISVASLGVLSGTGTLSAPFGVVNQGMIAAQNGLLAISGGVRGSGGLQIGAGATLYLMDGASSEAVSFTGANATLELTLNGGGGLTSAGPITGFAQGDQIWLASGVQLTGLHYDAGSLTLEIASGSAGTLALSGNYAADEFLLTPASTYGWVITVAPLGAGTAANGNPGTDAFAWTGGSGNWGIAADWQDQASDADGVAVPGAANAVTLANAVTISGSGASASLLVAANDALSGTFSTGALTIGSGELTIGGGAQLSAVSATIGNGSIQAVGHSADLEVAGVLTIGSADLLSLAFGGGALAGSVSLSGGQVAVDAYSSLEIGTLGTAAAGTLTVDAGRSLAGAGVVTASGGVVNQGTITAQGGTLQIGDPVTGSGQLDIGAGATLSLYAGASSDKVGFTGDGGTLEVTLTGSGSLTEAGTITGFTTGDTIYFASGTPITATSYSEATGTLTLLDGSTAIGALDVQGVAAGYVFQLTQNGTYGTDITVTPKYASPDPLFDAAWYLKEYPDVAAAGVDPYWHYMTYGWKEGRNPSPYFNTNYYLNQNPDVAAAGVNPLTHYETYGWHEGRDPSIGFSTTGYLQANPGVASAGVDPLLQYVETGQAEGQQAVAATAHAVGTPDPLVDYAYYYAQHPDVAASGEDATENYDTVGWKLGYNPNPYFDTDYYLAQNPDVAASGMDPLTHYEEYGWREGRTPSLLFDGNSYLSANPDVAAAGVDPLQQYLQNGISEGRIGFMPETSTADPLVNTSYYDKQLGATLIPTGTEGQAEATASYNSVGWERGLNPDAFFDTSYYLAQNPDVAAAGVNPLLHYEVYGWREGRNPSPLFDTDKYLAAYSDVRQSGMDPLLQYVQFGQAEGRTTFSV